MSELSILLLWFTLGLTGFSVSLFYVFKDLWNDKEMLNYLTKPRWLEFYLLFILCLILGPFNLIISIYQIHKDQKQE